MKIMRVYRCSVVAGKEAEFREFAFKRSHPWLRDQPGLISFHAGRSLPDSGERVRFMVQIWESIDALKAAIGDDWHRPGKLSDEARSFIEAASVEHYELADEYRAGVS